MTAIRSMLVYCGANSGSLPVYADTTRSFARMLANENIRLIYGGGSIGLMGILADEVLNAGGKVTGVIPDFLNVKEVGHTGLTEMHEVKSMHERKALMEKLCDSAVALPGGFGTMDEIFEMLTWAQLGLHSKPLGLLNVNGYYDHFVAQLDKMVEDGFLKKTNRDLIIVSESPEELLELLRNANPVAEEKWLKRGEG